MRGNRPGAHRERLAAVDGLVMRWVWVAFVAVFAVGCAQTSVTPLSRNQVMVHVNAAPVCGPSGASNVALRTAAVQALRNGFERFQIFGGDQYSNVEVINRPLSQGGTMVTGGHSINLRVLMTNPGDPGYDDGLDAKEVLGENWESDLDKPIVTCG